MKKLLLLFIMSILSMSCSDESENSSSEMDAKLLKSQEVTSDSDSAVALATGICPDGYVPAWTWEFPMPFAYRVKACNGGFGFCLGLSGGFTFDCVKISKLEQYNQSKVKSNSVDDTMNPVLVKLTPTMMRLYVSKGVDLSRSHVPSDFNLLEIGDVQIDNNHTLNAGNYNKQVNSYSYYYDIPYTYIP